MKRRYIIILALFALAIAVGVVALDTGAEATPAATPDVIVPPGLPPIPPIPDPVVGTLTYDPKTAEALCCAYLNVRVPCDCPAIPHPVVGTVARDAEDPVPTNIPPEAGMNVPVPPGLPPIPR